VRVVLVKRVSALRHRFDPGEIHDTKQSAVAFSCICRHGQDRMHDLAAAFLLNMNNRLSIPLELIKQSLRLDSSSKTGLRWIQRPQSHFNSRNAWIRTNAKSAGKEAGWLTADNKGKFYYGVRFNNRNYKAHRIVYALAFDCDPGNMEIDHIDGNGLNNTLSNLRIATHAQNLRNRGKTKANTSGKKGVYFSQQSKKWGACVRVNNKTVHLGLFDDINKAAAAYDNAANIHYGSFASTNTQPNNQ
jgi:hypothetical protein